MNACDFLPKKTAKRKESSSSLPMSDRAFLSKENWPFQQHSHQG